MNATAPIRRLARATPAAAAYQSAIGNVVSYEELERTIDAIAHRIRDRGIVAGRTAVIATDHHYRYIVVALAMARLGVAFAPASLPARYTDVVLQDAGAKGNGCGRIIAFGEFWPGGSRDAHAALPPVAMHEDASTTFMQCPSSGTTGGPKFVPISHAIVLRRVAGRDPKSGGEPSDTAVRQACLVSVFTSYGFTSVLSVLSAGGTVLEPCRHADLLPTWLADSRVTHIVGAPIALEKIAWLMPDDHGTIALKAIEVGGGALTASVHELLCRRMCANITINYGSTESGRVCGAAAAQILGREGAVGFRYPGVEIEIVDESDARLGPGEEGIVRLRSERCATRYLDNAQASAATFRGGWTYPGGVGVVDADGLLRILGRVDDVINRGGVKINPHTIEAAIMALGDVREVAVFGFRSAEGITVVGAAVVPLAELDPVAYHARCRNQIGQNAPVLIMHLRELPRNSNGKVLRRELASMALASRSSAVSA